MRAAGGRLSGRSDAGFTLIELLVVIAIVGLLVAILLPALARARAMGRQAVESAAANQLINAYLQYAGDNGGLVLPVRLPPQDFMPPRPKFLIKDESGRELAVTTAMRYPWRIAPYIEYDMRAIMVDKSWHARFAAMGDFPHREVSRQAALASHPSLGMNWALDGRFAKLRQTEQYRVTRLDQVNHTARVLVFASAQAEFEGEKAPGWDQLYSPVPRAQTTISGFYDNPEVAWDPDEPGARYGNLDLRHFNKAVVAFFDGHVSLLGLRAGDRSGLRDMRHWADAADRADWTPDPS